MIETGPHSQSKCAGVESMHNGEAAIGKSEIEIFHFASHFIRIQIFQIDFPLILYL